MQELGLDVKAVSNNPEVLVGTQPVVKQVAPGIVVQGNQDQAGNFFVLDGNNTVHNVTPTTDILPETY